VTQLLFPDPEEVEDLVVAQVSSSALFASRFRENATRALLLPRPRPGTRTPLWQQRQRAADLLAVASRYGSFPILVETYREVLFGRLRPAGAAGVLGGIASREITVHGVETMRPRRSRARCCSITSPPSCTTATRRWPSAEPGALTLDRDLLRELLGQEELRELLDPEALADLELSLQALTDDRKATTADQLPRPVAAPGRPVGGRGRGPLRGRIGRRDGWIVDLVGSRRAVRPGSR
jgi:ATP-dependent Lhr-like helicase